MKTKENRRGRGGHRGTDLLETLPSIRFAGRELRPYAEPVESKRLRKNEVYFAVTFADEDLLIPIVDTLVFVGKNLDSEDEASYYFQDIYSHRRGVKYSAAAHRRGDFEVFSGSAVSAVFEYERALDQLMLCSIRRSAGTKSK